MPCLLWSMPPVAAHSPSDLRRIVVDKQHRSKSDSSRPDRHVGTADDSSLPHSFNANCRFARRRLVYGTTSCCLLVACSEQCDIHAILLRGILVQVRVELGIVRTYIQANKGQ